jgi:predicted kinase
MHVVLMMGIPGSGKTTRAKELVAANVNNANSLIRVNKDDIRAMMGLSYSPESEKIVRAAHSQAIVAALRNGYSVIVDDTGNLKPRTQQEIQSLIRTVENSNPEHGPIQMLVNTDCMSVPVEQCIKQDLQRPNSVGEAVIRHWADRYLPKPPAHVHRPELKSAIVVDIDNCLAVMGDRPPLDYKAAGIDKVNPPVAHLLKAIDGDVILLTGREESGREVLEDWLDRNFIVHSGILFMRPDGDRTPGSQFKKKVLQERILPRWNIELIVDDDPAVIDAAKQLGIPSLQVSL